MVGVNFTHRATRYIFEDKKNQENPKVMTFSLIVLITFIILWALFSFLKSCVAPLIIMYLLKGQKVTAGSFFELNQMHLPLYKNFCIFQFFARSMKSHIFLIERKEYELGKADYFFLGKNCYLMLNSFEHTSVLSQINEHYFSRKYSWWERYKGGWHTLFLMAFLLGQYLFRKFSSPQSEIKQNIIFLLFYPLIEISFYFKNIGPEKLMNEFLKDDYYQRWKMELNQRPKFFKYLFFDKYHSTI